MSEHILLGIGLIIGLGIVAQWLAWRTGLPSILLLLLFGFGAGPITGLLDPDKIFGPILFPAVSLAVALILFEGGLRLRLSELRQTGLIVRNLVSIGVVTTWLLSAGLAYLIFDMALPLALLFGAILVVTGPTVIVPLLRQVRVVGRISSIVKWEGIINDPIGALLTVLVFEAILAGTVQASALAVVTGLLQTIFDGVILGGLAAGLLILLLKRYWIPDYLQNSVTLMIVVGAFLLSDMLQKESGLFTVTLMGVILANQKWVNIQHIIEFKENLGVMLLSSLFIVLAARLDVADLAYLGPESLIYLAVLVLVVRPVSVWLSTFQSDLDWREKTFLAWMAPRGIVAAAVTSVFALDLVEQAGHIEAEMMVPRMFLIIAGTVAIYGLSAVPLGRWLGVAPPNPQGVLIVGAHFWAIEIAQALWEAGYHVLMVDNKRQNIQVARLEGLPVFYGSILSEYALDEIDLSRMGCMLALTSNDEVNSLATLHFSEVFDRAAIHQLVPEETTNHRQQTVPQPLRARLLFSSQATYTELTRRFEEGAVIKKTLLTDQFDYVAFRQQYGQYATPLFRVDEVGNLSVFTTEYQIDPQPGQLLISLVDEVAAGKQVIRNNNHSQNDSET